MKQTAKFDIQDMLPIGITLVVLGIGVAYGLSVMGDVKDDIGEDMCNSTQFWNTSLDACCENSTADGCASGGLKYPSHAFNGTEDAVIGIAKLPEKLPTIVSVIVAAIIIGILIRYLLVRMS